MKNCLSFFVGSTYGGNVSDNDQTLYEVSLTTLEQSEQSYVQMRKQGAESVQP